MRRTLYACALSGSLLAACASTTAPPPDSERRIEELELPVPDGWASPASEGSVAEIAFWTPFQEPALDVLVAEALQHNHDLRASAARLAAAAQRSTIARSVRWPSLDASVGWSRTKNIFVGFPIPGSSGPLESLSTQWNAGLTANWEVDLWGRLAAGAAAADAAFAASAADHAAAQLSVAAETTRAWYAARVARLLVELGEQTVESYRGTLQVIDDRFQAGLVGALDVRLARANLASSEANLVTAERLAAVARRRIELVLGRYPEGELQVLGEFGELPPPVPAGLPAELLARRPDLASLERQLAAAEAFVDEKRADRWPRIVLTASGGTRSDAVDDLLDGDFSVWSLASSLTAPLFDAGRRAAAVDEARANARAAGEVFAGGVLAAFAEVENALDAEGSLRTGLGHLTVAVEEARAALGLADAQYREGLIGIELVLDAQRRLLISEALLVTTRGELFINRVDLVVALGGGFAAPSADAE